MFAEWPWNTNLGDTSVVFCEIALLRKTDFHKWRFEHRTNKKFCFKLGKTATETYKMLQKVYVETAVTNKTVFKWFRIFQEGNKSLEADERNDGLSTDGNDKNIVEIKAVIGANRRSTIRKIAEDTNISFGSVQARQFEDV